LKIIKSLFDKLESNLFYVWCSLIAFPTLLVVVMGVYYNSLEKSEAYNTASIREKSVAKTGKISIEASLSGVKSNLLFLSELNDFKNYINVPKELLLSKCAVDYKLFMKTSGIYDQIRWIDENGLEKIRVDYKNGNPLIVPKEKLQNKSHRYYFLETMKLPHGQIYISPFDLNMEHKKIELPYKPMLRIARTVYDSQGVKKGVFILNYLGKNLLKDFALSTAFTKARVMLYNSDGYCLKGAKKDEWAFMFNHKDDTLAKTNPQVWQKISQNESGQFQDKHGIWTFQTVRVMKDVIGEKYYKIVTFLSDDIIYKTANQKFYYMLFVVFVLLFIVGFASWILTYFYKKKEKLFRELEKFSMAIEQTDDIIMMVDPLGRIFYVNQAFCRITGFSKEEAIGQQSNILKSSKHDKDFYKDLWNTILSGEIYHGVLINKKKNGTHYYEKKTIAPLKEKDGSIRCFVSTGEDVSKEMKYQKEILKMATTDQLTNAYNRHKFLELYEIESERARRFNETFSIILIDIDNFKAVNDLYGHDVGDEILKKLVNILTLHSRKIDIVSRWGGEEFLLLCPQADVNNIKIIAEKIRAIVQNSKFETVKHLTISLGISTFQKNDTFQDIFKRADKSVYIAKNSGKNRVGPLTTSTLSN